MSILLLALASTWTIAAADLGDKAPSLQIEQWVKGEALDLNAGKGKTIFVLVFLETGCDYCRESFPRLTEWQKKFKDQGVEFIGISAEPAIVLRSFVESLGDQVGFAVAADAQRKTYTAYMTAFGEVVVPHAFVVQKNGLIAWRGHPFAGLEKAIREIVAGEFDLAAAQRIANAEKLQQRYVTLVSEERKNPEAGPIGNQILTDGRPNPWLLNNFAWSILTDPGIKHRDFNLALRAAKEAYDAFGGNESAFADTYARALFDTGKTAEAIKIQKHAIETCKEPRQKPGLEESLKYYQQKYKD